MIWAWSPDAYTGRGKWQVRGQTSTPYVKHNNTKRSPRQKSELFLNLDASIQRSGCPGFHRRTSSIYRVISAGETVIVSLLLSLSGTPGGRCRYKRHLTTHVTTSYIFCSQWDLHVKTASGPKDGNIKGHTLLRYTDGGTWDTSLCNRGRSTYQTFSTSTQPLPKIIIVNVVLYASSVSTLLRPILLRN